ncbi:hypothetical protein N0B31_19975 [Salinirubellus salinus]|uniref:Uncharacterized protein n=1 Tax=Salinirubellus salinus TaxID=1364945 RepID=A0A9E7R419_9EURY|nr:hypothetical protein [Salinirubellus salinus]UWM54383.1 hypothetical protein N0B31_19975 [Salinirubellus salinus]
MQPPKHLSRIVEQIRNDGFEGVSDVLYELYAGFLWSKVSRRVGGRHPFDHDWDLLVVLDACRADVLREVAGEYPFVGDLGETRSVGSTSEEWLLKTFSPQYREEMRRTTYVTGNPFSDSMLEADEFAALDEVWRYAWDEELGTIPAEPITAQAVARGRADDADRMIVHYMQPHFPSVLDPGFGSAIDLDTVGERWESVWDQLRKGRVSREDVWTAYRRNLEYVLEHVAVLLSNVEAETAVVTADHGNSFGSWGVYGHPPAAIPAVRTVPWCVTTAEDTGTYDLAGDLDSRGVGEGPRGPGQSPLEADVEDKLRDLGYL